MKSNFNRDLLTNLFYFMFGCSLVENCYEICFHITFDSSLQEKPLEIYIATLTYSSIQITFILFNSCLVVTCPLLEIMVERVNKIPRISFYSLPCSFFPKYFHLTEKCKLILQVLTFYTIYHI